MNQLFTDRRLIMVAVALTLSVAAIVMNGSFSAAAGADDMASESIGGANTEELTGVPGSSVPVQAGDLPPGPVSQQPVETERTPGTETVSAQPEQSRSSETPAPQTIPVSQSSEKAGQDENGGKERASTSEESLSEEKGANAQGLLKQAAELEKNGKHAGALAKYASALKMASDSKDQKLAAAALRGAAKASFSLGKDKDALAYVNRSITINQSLKNAKERSLDLILCGRILIAQANHAAALESFQDAAKILPVSEATELPGLLEDTASCLLRLNRPSEALAALNRALPLSAKQGNEAESARLNLFAGDIHVSRADYATARTHYKKAEKIYRDLKQKKELGETLFRCAYLDQMLGDVKSAQEAVEEGQGLLAGETDTRIAALPLLVKGMKAHREGNIIQALKDLSSALNGYEAAGDAVMAARVRLNLGNLQLDRSRFKSALELGGQALEVFRKQSIPGGEAAALLLIGEVYFRQGFVQKSLEYVQEASNLTRKINDRNQMVLSRCRLAEIHDGLGNTETVPKVLKEAVEEAKAGVNRRTRAELRLALARFRLSKEDTDKALFEAGEARKDFEESDDRRGMADCDHLMGLAHGLRGERDKAFELLQRALGEHSAAWDRFGEGRDLTALGVHFKSIGDQEKALEYFGKALEIRQGIDDRRGVAANLANIGNVLRRRHEVSEAQSKLEQALATYRELSDKRGEADTLTNLGHVDAARGISSAALEKLGQALKLHREIQDTRGIATDLASMGKLYLARGDLAHAQSSLEEAVRINKHIRNPGGEVAILAELAMLQRAKGNSSAALSVLNKALELARQTKDEQAVASINLKTATILEDSGDYPKALSLLDQTLAAMRQQGDRKGELWALSGIGVIQAKTEDYENALKNLHEALKLRNELGLSPSQFRDLDFYLGEIYEGFRDLDLALEHYHRALSLAQTPGNETVLGLIYDRIGNIYYRMEEYSRAKDFLDDALRLSAETRNVAMRKSQLIRMGDIASKLGDSEGALKYQKSALDLSRESHDQQTEARILTRIGTLYQTLGRPNTALEHYQEALEIHTKLGNRRGLNENLLQIALVSSTLGDADSAVKDLKRAFDIAQSSEDRSMLWKAYFIMGRTLEAKQSPGEALEAYRKALDVLERIETEVVADSDEEDFIFGGKTALFETTLRVLMRLAKKDPGGAYDSQALKIAEKLKAGEFETTLSRINVESFSDLPPELLVREKSLRLTLTRLNAHLEQERSRVNPDQAQIKKLLDERTAKENTFKQLKELLLKEFPAYAELRYARPILLDQIQKAVIDPDEAIFEYIVTRSRTYLFAIDNNRLHTYTTDYSGQELEKDVEILTRPLHRAEAQASWDPSVAHRLYSRLIKPLEYFIVGKKTVVIVPHGPLAGLPFEILVDSPAHAGKRFWSATDRPSHLVEKYAFCYEPSLSVLSQVRTRKRTRNPGWNLVAFGDAIYSDASKNRELNPGAEKLMSSMNLTADATRGEELRPLPGARKEISEIVKIMGGPHQAYLGEQATESLFKKADLSRYAYIHLATHGVLLGGGKHQQQPAIIFSLYGDKGNDGFLQLGEAFGLRLNSDLVVLSSCLTPAKSARAEGYGLMGLARAFLFAGTNSVILSAWQVNDDSTPRLFIEMYRDLKDGSKAEALREAKLTLLKNSGTSHPYYWGPFVLVGDWHVKLHPSLNTVNVQNAGFKGRSAWRRLLNM